MVVVGIMCAGPALGSAGPNWEQLRSAQVPSQLAPRSVELGPGPNWLKAGPVLIITVLVIIIVVVVVVVVVVLFQLHHHFLFQFGVLANHSMNFRLILEPEITKDLEV